MLGGGWGWGTLATQLFEIYFSYMSILISLAKHVIHSFHSYQKSDILRQTTRCLGITELYGAKSGWSRPDLFSEIS